MWVYNNDYKKWEATGDKLLLTDYELLKQELSSVRFYSKCLSGATYLPVHTLDNIYDILGEYKPRNWYISTNGSPYSNTGIPAEHAEPIFATTSYDYYTKYLTEYGLTLKNLFTPERLIKDANKNYILVDLATTESLADLPVSNDNRIIDGVRLLEGHRVLIKDQITRVTLLSAQNPDDYFLSSYTVVQNFGATIEYQTASPENGIYIYKNGLLVRETDLEDYDDCRRFSVVVKNGASNFDRQFHLVRLLNGYYPTTSKNEPIQFTESKNWLLRNKVDYNNLFEINYYDVIKNPIQSYFIGGITYSIPERTIAVGEFGIILNTQEGISNIIYNKYKINLRSISQTSKFYFICGDDGLLLKVRKHDFFIERLILPTTNNLRSVSFFDDLKGVVVGDLNAVYVTDNGGVSWQPLKISAFDAFYFTKVIYYSPTAFFASGNVGIFVEFKRDITGWTAFKRRISRFIDDDDEYLLVDNINDIYYTTLTTWGLSYSYSTQSIPVDKAMLFIVTDDSKIIVHDINSFTNFDFLYLDFPSKYGDIRNITKKFSTNEFYFTGIEEATGDAGLFSFDLSNFTNIGVGNSYSNTILSTFSATYKSDLYGNEIVDYFAQDIIIAGNESLLKSSTYSTPFNFNVLDVNFENRLKSKLLFLDYDAGSKLNFFTDFGEYRLPNSLTFSFTASTGTYFDFTPLVYGATGPSYMTQSETNWIDYWKDSQMTFEYYSLNPMTASSKVLMTTTFSYSSNNAVFNVSTFSAFRISYDFVQTGQYFPDIDAIKSLAPTISDEGHSRFYSIGLTAISAPTYSYDLYFYDYLMVAKLPTTYPVQVGDVIRFESNVVEGNFIVNKLANLSGDNYAYMFTEFDNAILKELTASFSITLTNLNYYNNSTELSDRFNLHPISKAYSLSYDATNSVAEISTEFNNFTSYYNLATNVNTHYSQFTMSYTSGFLKFGYSPTYNLLDYLESINELGDPNPKFYATKEYYAMPDLRDIPMPGLNSFTFSVAYVDYNGMTAAQGLTVSNRQDNKILFGQQLEFEWNSIFINTFIDINLYATSSVTTTERALVTKKYRALDENGEEYFVIELHKRLNYAVNVQLYKIDIISRRKLYQISDDLQQLNLIQRPVKSKDYLAGSGPNIWFADYNQFEREMNFKVNTDSYAKVLLSDVDTLESISAVLYTDYKNEYAMNVTRLGKEVSVPILNTANFAGNLFISCSEKHGLKDEEGVVLEFTGLTGSSAFVNQQYFGYHPIKKVNEYNFYINFPYGTVPLVGNDFGFVKYYRQDPFLGYEPVDLIDVGVDKKGKIAIELTTENTIQSGATYSLSGVDFGKYRFRLVDGLNIETLAANFPWIYEAEISGAVIGQNGSDLVWYKGRWECGRWFGGIWQSGYWKSGDWYGGTWNSRLVKDNWINVEVDERSSGLSHSTWVNGRWYDGTWNNGTWANGRWYGGTWNDGIWYKGIWNDGTWNMGKFNGGIWVLGTWNGGIFNTDNEPSYWLDGYWYGGDFENGMWYSGLFEQKNAESRFGTNAYNSRTATWHGGKWISGSFHSRLNVNDAGQYDVSDVHKYSIWYTGQWFSGDFYGGVAYNMNFKSGTWHGGILEDIQVIGLTGSATASNNYFTLNGIFKFGIGDQVTIIDNQIGNTYSIYGSNANPQNYTVLYTVEDTLNKHTNVYVNRNITLSVNPPVDVGIRFVSEFSNCNWKSGIWTNGLFNTGLWEGGIWYGGVFGNNAVWM